MKTCKNCKYWGNDQDSVCEVVENIGNEDFFIKVSSTDDQGLEGLLVTGANFGCIKFKKRGET